MFNRQSIHIAMLLWGCIFSLIAALCIFMSRNFQKDKRILMLLMQLSCAILLGSDALAWAYRGNIGMTGYYMVRISNFLVFIFSDILLMFFHAYVCCYLFGDSVKESDRVKRINAGYCICIICILLVVVSQFTELYYHFDSNNLYHRNQAYIISLLLPMVCMLIDLSMLIQYKKNISREIFVAMLSYIILPFLATVILIFYYGISLVNIAISISMILMFIVEMVEQNRVLAIKEKEVMELQISLMLSQIAPHFIYNTLTTIKALCTKNPEEAKETIDDFAGYLRGNLDLLNCREKIPFERELEHTKYYLAIEKKRFGSRINVEYYIEEENFLIPALTLQPIVENSVKHGICKKPEGGTIVIKTEKKENKIYIIVEDDGVGFDNVKIKNDKTSHVGIQNVQNRIKSISKGEVNIESVVGKGTIAVITIPM